MSFHSFQNSLIQLLKIINPEHILELGAGMSSKIMIENSNALIYSFEESEYWFHKYSFEIKNERFRIIQSAPGWTYFEKEFDFIFIDSGSRIEVLNKSKENLSDKGVIFLHDAHREEYEPGILLYKYFFFPEKHSCIITDSLDMYLKIKNTIIPDYSCKCHYCSSPERIEYFNKMITKDFGL